jgi:hypothetical protein
VIKAAGRTGLGEPLLLLGLSGENVTRLTAGEPVRITSAQMAAMGLPPIMIVIHYGRTEQAILDEFAAHGLTPKPGTSAPASTEG